MNLNRQRARSRAHLVALVLALACTAGAGALRGEIPTPPGLEGSEAPMLCAGLAAMGLGRRSRRPRNGARPGRAERRFRALVDLSPDAILMHSGGKFVYANRAAMELLRADRAERIVGLAPADLVAPDCRELAQARLQRLLPGKSVPPTEMRWLRFDGTAVEVEVSASLLVAEGSISIQVFVRDITERKQAQRHILRLTDLYSALSRTSQAVARLRDRDALFAEVCSIAAELGHLSATWIGLIDAAGEHLVPAASSGAGAQYARSIEVPLDPQRPAGNGPIAVALREDRIYVCNDLDADPRTLPWRSVAQGFGFRSVAVFPLRQSGRPVGAIMHYANETGFFDAQLTELLSRMASGISVALERFASEAALRDKQRQMEILLSNLPGMVYRCRDDADWTMEFVSEGCLELTGYRPEELMLSRTVSFEGITHAEDRARVRDEIHRALRTGGRFALEYRIRTRDGREKWVQEKGLGTYSPDGELLGLEGFVSDVTEIKTYRERLEHQATHDTLTGLANRHLLNERMLQAMAHVRRQGGVMAVVFLDLDQFKFVNDTLGHTAGDELLKQAAERLRGCVREGDTVARLGGDEFVLLLAEQPHAQAVSQAVERVLSIMAQPYPVLGKEFATTCSIGVSLFPQDGDDVETMLKHADAAMYRAKAMGRNGFHFFTAEINAALSERLSLEHDLRRAIQANEFQLHYQPKVALRSGMLIGAEALVRWAHPEQGMLSPVRFIPLAEETGLILPLGEWILRQACMQARAWLDAGLELKLISVNISARQFHQHDLVQRIADVLNATGLPPACLELELTESMMMADAEEDVSRLNALKALGMQLSVDDFGTGYSSLSYLKRFPVDRLKIDKSFVRDIVTDPGDAAIAQAVIRLGQILGLVVTAEGVETDEQLEFLRRHGCDEAQGYYFSPPLPPDAFVELWRRGLLAPKAWAAPVEFPAVV
jgi:diguanylate cyclase (GGDEF)-like protein/PAS domain S-box-containing protein